MYQKQRFRVFTDLEYCYPGMKKGSPRPTDDDQRQIVQIAAILADMDTGAELATLNVLVRPMFVKKLPAFFTELTGITQDELDRNGLEFATASLLFSNFCADYPVWTFDKDENVWRQNYGYVKKPFPLSNRFTRVKPLLSGWGVDPNAFSSGTLHRAAGIPMKGHVHNALHDVRSMATAVRYFESKDTQS